MDTGAAQTPRDPWHPARRALGDELLASLLGASPSSVRRYATGARTQQNGSSPLERLQQDPDWTPDSEAAREVAHLARVSGDTQAT